MAYSRYSIRESNNRISNTFLKTNTKLPLASLNDCQNLRIAHQQHFDLCYSMLHLLIVCNNFTGRANSPNSNSLN